MSARIRSIAHSACAMVMMGLLKLSPTPSSAATRKTFSVARFHICLRDSRSEEHTSELQSLMRISYAVFCLKKKKNNNIIMQMQNKLTHLTPQRTMYSEKQ